MTKGKGIGAGFPFIYCEGGKKELGRYYRGNCHNYFWSVNVLTMISRGIQSITS